MVHTVHSGMKVNTPDSYNRLDVTFEHRFGVKYRAIFADHFLNLGHTGEC